MQQNTGEPTKQPELDGDLSCSSVVDVDDLEYGDPNAFNTGNSKKEDKNQNWSLQMNESIQSFRPQVLYDRSLKESYPKLLRQAKRVKSNYFDPMDSSDSSFEAQPGKQELAAK